MKIIELWRDERGAMLAAEFILFATVLVLALVVGLGYLSQVINQQIIDQANAIAASEDDEFDEDDDESLVEEAPDYLTADEVYDDDDDD